jgi:hypothetical protein
MAGRSASPSESLMRHGIAEKALIQVNASSDLHRNDGFATLR